jgi:plasmid stability protein
MDTTIRNLDDSAYRALKARAALEQRSIGELVSDAIRQYLVRPIPAEKSASLGDIRPWDFGPGTEHLSEQIDEILYDDPHGEARDAEWESRKSS